MSTLKTIVYSIMEAIHEHHITDDHDISLEYIRKKINDINQKLIEERYRSGESLDYFYQEICCVDVLCKKRSCVINGETIYEDTITWYSDLTNLNTSLGWKAIKYIGNSDYASNQEFHRLSLSGFQSIKGRRWTGHKTFYFVNNTEVLYHNLPTTGIKKVCVLAILNDPTSACNWDDETTPYPTPDPYKLELLVKQDILSTFGISKDEVQDSRDTTGQQEIKQENKRQQ